MCNFNPVVKSKASQITIPFVLVGAVVISTHISHDIFSVLVFLSSLVCNDVLCYENKISRDSAQKKTSYSYVYPCVSSKNGA